MKKSLLGAAICAASVLGFGTSALAGGPPRDVLEGNENTWACEDDGGLPVNHCINVRSQGNTGLIIVLDDDSRWPAEGISFDPKSDDRPCPHDPDSSDGTWWTPPDDTADGPLWVCHHKP